MNAAGNTTANRDRNGATTVLTTVLALVLPLLLAGCGIYDKAFGSKEPPLPCPRVAALPDAIDLVQYLDGPGRDLIDISYRGAIEITRTTCEYERHEVTGAGSMTVEITLRVDAERGPANRDRQARFPYFVSLVGADRQPITKEEFILELAFPGNRTALKVFDAPIVLTVPLKPQEPGTSYRIYVGFQMTKEQLEENRRRRARRR